MSHFVITILQVLIPGLLIFGGLIYYRRFRSSQPHTPPKKLDKILKPKPLNKDTPLLSQPSQDGLDGKMRDSAQTELMSEVKEGSSIGKSSSTRDTVRSDEISPKLITSKGEKGEISKKSSKSQVINQVLKASLPQPESQRPSEENLIHCEGMQPAVRRRQNPQNIQGDTHRGNNEINMMGTTRRIESQNHGRGQDEDQVVELRELNDIEQATSLYKYKEKVISEEELKKSRALEDLKKFNLAKIRLLKDKSRIQETCQKECVEKYLKFCEVAGVNHLKYHQDNIEAVRAEDEKMRIIRLLQEEKLDVSRLKWRKDNLPCINSAHGQIVFWLTRYGYYS